MAHRIIFILLLFLDLIVAAVLDNELVLELDPSPRDDDGTTTSDIQSRIVNGDQVGSSSDYPFFVSWAGKCGGSLIHGDIVLSAAHCGGLSISYDSVVVNAYKLNFLGKPSLMTIGAEERSILDISVHPNYDSSTFANDVLIIKLDKPIENANIQPISLHADQTIDLSGQSIKVIGLGVTENEGAQPKYLQEVTVEVVSDEFCNDAYGTSKIFDDLMLCAKGHDDNDPKDSCQGDSGGPAFTFDPETNSVREQVGIVSWGLDCADPKHPGVYTEVSAVSEWIKSEICRISSIPPPTCPPPPEAGAVHLSCVDEPEGWYDADGPIYRCSWYNDEERCQQYGDHFGNFMFGGKTANQACCSCGGGKVPHGSTGGHDNPAISPALTSSPSVSPTKESSQQPTSRPSLRPSASVSPTTTSAKQPSPTYINDGSCFDDDDWYDADGPKYNCDWYEEDQPRNCENYGYTFENFGKTANQVCCVCKAVCWEYKRTCRANSTCNKCCNGYSFKWSQLFTSCD